MGSAISPKGRIEIAARHVVTLATEQERFDYLLGVFAKMERDLMDRAEFEAHKRVALRLTGIVDKLHRQFDGVISETRGRIRDFEDRARWAPPSLASTIEARRAETAQQAPSRSDESVTREAGDAQ